MATSTTVPEAPADAVEIRVGGRPAANASAPRGRRKSDVASVSLPDWLDAPLLKSEDPRDGNLVDPDTAAPDDYVLEFHQSTGTASWLRVHAAPVVVDGATLITCGRLPGVTLSFAAGRQAWVLRRDAAAALAFAASDRVLRPFGEPERAMEKKLRGFKSRAALIKGWPDEATLADAVTVWEMLRVSDLANRTDARRIASRAVVAA